MKRQNNGWIYAGMIILILAAWHLLGVRDAAAATGDSWLVVWYLILAVVVLAGVIGTGFLLGKRPEDVSAFQKRMLKLEQVYPILGLFLGILYLLVLPPLSAPDEISHYISAYQLSSRMMGQEANYETGHVLVRAEDLLLEDIHGNGTFEVDEQGIWIVQPETEQSSQRIPLGQTLVEESYRTIYETVLLGKSHALEQRFPDQDLKEQLAVSPYPPVVTTPLAYVPQAIGITIARLLDMGSIWLAYLGRLCNLLFFVTMTTLAMKRLPFGKEVLFGVAMLPMTLHLSASFSYDVMIMACLFYFTALCLDLAYRKEKVGLPDVAAAMVLMAIAGPCKMVYAPLMGLCLLIPVKKFGGWQRWGISAAAVVGSWAAAMLLVNRQTIVSYATVTEQVVPWAEEAGYSLTYALHNPIRTLKIFYETVLLQADHYHLTMIGSKLGNLDEILNVPYLVVLLLTGCLIMLMLRKPGENLVLVKGRRIWIMAVCALCVGVTMLSMLIAWTPLSSSVILGVQGRYFLPFLPVFLMACKNDAVVLTKNRNRSILYLMFCVNGYVLLRLFSTVSMRL